MSVASEKGVKSANVREQDAASSDRQSTEEISDNLMSYHEKDEKTMTDRDVEKQEPKPDTATQRGPRLNNKQEADSSLVWFDGPDDPANPMNWSTRRKAAISASLGWMTFVVTFSSSIFSVAIGPVSEEFHISEVTATLGVSMFLLGFVAGPIVFGPMSEVFGRKIPIFSGYIVFAIFQIPVAVATNVETIMLCRFLGGFAATAPVAVMGGLVADLWPPVERAYAVCVLAAGAFTGPVAGPIVGGFVTESYLGWRWTAWITLIMATLFGTIGWLVIEETSSQRILQKKAKALRYQTGNWALHAKADEKQITLNTIVNVYLMRPFIMLVQEPILALMTAYMSYLYGVIYLLFEAYPISFKEQRGWSLGVSALPFVSFIIGIFLGTGVMAYSTATNFKRAFIKHGRPIPEERLPPMILAAVLLPAGMFWFAWTSFPSITWVPQVMSSALIGMGLLVAFWQGTNYLIDCYGWQYSNSALAANTFIRSMAGAGFPLFAPSMYRSLGVPWATSVLAFICVAFMPAPLLFYIYGAKIREKSRFAPT